MKLVTRDLVLGLLPGCQSTLLITMHDFPKCYFKKQLQNGFSTAASAASALLLSSRTGGSVGQRMAFFAELSRQQAYCLNPWVNLSPLVRPGSGVCVWGGMGRRL